MPLRCRLVVTYISIYSVSTGSRPGNEGIGLFSLWVTSDEVEPTSGSLELSLRTADT
jgi:hypothetical protein